MIRFICGDDPKLNLILLVESLHFYSYIVLHTATQDNRLYTFTVLGKNYSTTILNVTEIEKGDGNAEQLISFLLAAPTLCQLTTFEPDSGATSFILHCHQLFGWQSCQQPGKRDAPC